MPVRQQLTIAWQNRPGELANVCAVLADVGVNIDALATAEAGEYGAVRMLVDDVEAARRVFREAGVAHTTIDVLALEIPNSPGALTEIAGRLGYTDASNFARAFRRETGVSPQSFRHNELAV